MQPRAARRLTIRGGTPWALMTALAALMAGAALLGATLAPRTAPSAARSNVAATATSDAPVALPSLPGPIGAPSGLFLRDGSGRVVFLHGVNVVYKHWQYEVYPDPGKPWNFGVRDARRIAALGFDVVRLGVIWAGLEPGGPGPNSPSICRAGNPINPHELRRSVVDAYLHHLRQTIDLLAQYHIYTLLDMHQDVYSSVLGGEGAPRWAVCTNGTRPARPPGRWSRIYGTPAANIAYNHFWTNNVVGDLQGQYDSVWTRVARFFRHDPWVLGFDPFNEPFSSAAFSNKKASFDGMLECFYTGQAHADLMRTTRGVIGVRCPPGDPRTGVLPRLRRAAPRALLFTEPALYAGRHSVSTLGPMPFRNLVFNVHIYCTDRNPRTGNPIDAATCAADEARSLRRRLAQRRGMASRYQPDGPPMVVTEFGATSDAAVLRVTTGAFDRALVGWMYWDWKYYRDPTGSSQEALVKVTGRLRSTAAVLSQVYAEAVAGTPQAMSYDATRDTFTLRYRTWRQVRAPTLIVVPTGVHYRHGYCAHVVGGRVRSAPGSSLLRVSNGAVRPHEVLVRLTPGSCSPAR